MKGTKTEYEQKLVSCDTFVVMPDLSGSGEVRRSKSKCKDQLNKILYFQRSFLVRTRIDPRVRFKK